MMGRAGSIVGSSGVGMFSSFAELAIRIFYVYFLKLVNAVPSVW